MPKPLGTPTGLVLTLFAVAGDTVMVGAAAALVGFILWLEIGAPTRIRKQVAGTSASEGDWSV